MSAKGKRRKGDCPNCGRGRWASVRGHHRRADSDEISGFSWASDWFLLQCPACDQIYVQVDRTNSEDYSQKYESNGEIVLEYIHEIEHWPVITRKRPFWLQEIYGIDNSLSILLEEVYGALDSELKIAAAIAIRTVFDRASELLGIAPDLRFDQKLSGLLEAGKIGIEERDLLDVLTDAGSAAAHRGWMPNLEELGHMLSTIEGFLHRNFVLGKKMNSLKTRVPPRAVKKGNK